jgi:hypothetical protein
MLFYLIHKIFHTNCLQALGSSLVFGSIIYIFLLFFIKTPVFSLLIPLDLLFTYHCYINKRIANNLELCDTKKYPQIKKPHVNPQANVILKKKIQVPDTNPIEIISNINPIKYVQKQPRIRDTLNFTVQNLGI